MKKLLIAVLISVFWVYGCSMPLGSVVPTYRSGKTYELGLIHRANLGSPMLTIYRFYEIPVYKPKYEFQPPKAGLVKTPMPPLTPTQRWIAHYTHKGNPIVRSEEYERGVGIGIGLGIEIKPNGELANDKPWINMSGGSAPIVRMWQSSWKLPEPQLFVQTEGYPVKGSFEAQLIYNGISESVISILYREYVGAKRQRKEITGQQYEMGHPAFYQHLRYDLKQSDQIIFRSLKMKVLRATNQEILFRVLDDGGLLWVPRP